MPISQKTTITLIVCSLLLAGCAADKYEAKPLNVEKTTAKLLAKNVDNPDFKAYLAKQGYPNISAWGLDELTLCALYFNPKLEVAKAQLGLAHAQIESAGLKPNPTLNGTLARSNQANGDIRPWAYGLSVEIPIETANKRQIRIEEAQANAVASRMEIAATAWQLRSQLAKDLMAYHENIANTKLLQDELATQTQIVSLLKKRANAGLISNTDLAVAMILQADKQALVSSTQAQAAEIEARLAADVGLSLAAFKQMPLKPLEIDSTLSTFTSSVDSDFVSKNLQASALLNRIDIRRALTKYAAAEAKIKLEIAKQTPDISLTPGFIFEFGDKVWSLGLSSLLNLLHKNPTLVNEAKQMREIEGAQFEALQAQIIGDVNQAYAGFVAARQNLNDAQNQYSSQLQHTQRLQKQLKAGLIDSLELTQTSLGNNLAQQRLSSAKFELLKAADKLEDVLQAPLNAGLAALDE